MPTPEPIRLHPTSCPDCGTPITATNLWGQVTSCGCGWTIMGAMRDDGEAKDPRDE